MRKPRHQESAGQRRVTQSKLPKKSQELSAEADTRVVWTHCGYLVPSATDPGLVGSGALGKKGNQSVRVQLVTEYCSLFPWDLSLLTSSKIRFGLSLREVNALIFFFSLFPFSCPFRLLFVSINSITSVCFHHRKELKGCRIQGQDLEVKPSAPSSRDSRSLPEMAAPAPARLDRGSNTALLPCRGRCSLNRACPTYS